METERRKAQKWAAQQRIEYHRGNLSSEKIKALESLDGWSWNPNADSKDKAFRRFMERAKEKHGDEYKYDKVKYVNAHTHIIIECRNHGEFSQSPNAHVKGAGCRQCYLNKSNRKTVLDTSNGIVYNSVKEAAEVVGVKSSTLSLYLNGKRTNKTHLVWNN